MKKQLLVLTLLLFTPVFLNAQNLEAVIDRHLDAIGGKEAIQSLNEIKATGTVTLMDMEIPVVFYMKSRDRMRLEMDMMGQKMIQASNGETAWQVNPFSGINEPEEMPVENLQNDNLIDEILLKYGKKGYAFTYVGEEEFDGSSVYRLDIKADDVVQQHLFEKESGIRRAVRIEVPDGEQAGQFVITRLRDYKEVNGYKMPHTMKTTIGTENYMTISLEDISAEPIDDSLFEIDG